MGLSPMPIRKKVNGKFIAKKAQQVTQHVPQSRQRGETSYILEDMMNACVARKDQLMTGLGTDNMTAILAYFKHPS